MQSTTPATAVPPASQTPAATPEPAISGLGQAALIFLAALLAYGFGEFSSRRQARAERRERSRLARDAALAQFAMSGIDYLRHVDRNAGLHRQLEHALTFNTTDPERVKERAREVEAGLARAVDGLRMFYGELMLHEDRQDFREYIDSVFDRVLFIRGPYEVRGFGSVQINANRLEGELYRLLQTRRPVPLAERTPVFAPTASPAPAESPPAPLADQSPREAS